MGAAYFYHLTRAPVERTLPLLLGKALGAGWRVAVRGTSEERLDWLAANTSGGGYHCAEALMGYGPFAWWPVTAGTDDVNGDLICRPCWRPSSPWACSMRRWRK